VLRWRTATAWWRRRLAERRARRQAEDLVRHVLSDAEYAQLRREGFIEVRSRRVPGRGYRIPAGGSPVAALEPDGRLVYLCLQPALPVPPQELVLIQKLLLEGDEDEFWQRANRVGRALGRGFGRRLLG
jgi:hypothetical protein